MSIVQCIKITKNWSSNQCDEIIQLNMCVLSYPVALRLALFMLIRINDKMRNLVLL